MNTDQYQRPRSQRLHAAIAESVNFQDKPPGWKPPNEDAALDPDHPLAHLDPIQHQVLFNGLLEDWDNPVFTELGLCRAHGINLEQLIAVAELPAFQKYLAVIRKVHAMRRPQIESAAANTTLERLLYITQCNLDSASAMKECRLAIKQIIAILNPDPSSTSRARKEAAGPASEDHAPEQPDAPQSSTSPSQSTPTTPTSARGSAGETSPASVTPDISPDPDAPTPQQTRPPPIPSPHATPIDHPDPGLSPAPPAHGLSDHPANDRNGAATRTTRDQ